MQVAYDEIMEKEESPRRVRRRLRLGELVAAGSAATIARESDIPKSHISAMLAGKRGLGDSIAKKLERQYGKPEGWFDSQDNHATGSIPPLSLNQPTAPVQQAQVATENVALSAEAIMFSKMFASLPDDPFIRADIMGRISAMIQQAREPTQKNDVSRVPPQHKKTA